MWPQMSATFTMEWTLTNSHLQRIYSSIRHTWLGFQTKVCRAQLDVVEIGANLCTALFGLSDMKFTVFTPDNGLDCSRLLWCSLLNIRNWVNHFSTRLPWLTSDIRITTYQLTIAASKPNRIHLGFQRACPQARFTLIKYQSRLWIMSILWNYIWRWKIAATSPTKLLSWVNCARAIKDLTKFTKVFHRTI